MNYNLRKRTNPKIFGITTLIASGFLMSLLGFNLEAKAQETESDSRSTWTQNENSNQSETENQPTYNQNSTSAGSSQSVATISPTEGTVDVKLKNNTNATIDYQAIGYTENQTLDGGEEHVLRGLPVPVTIRSARQDDGFIKVVPLASEEGMLEVSLDEDRQYYDDNNLGVILIQQDGQVFVN